MQGVKIGDPVSFPENQHPEGVIRPGSSRTSTSAGRITPVRDEARLSLDWEKVERLKAELSRLPEIRQERVEALSQAIREGRYQATDRQIADAIISELMGHPLLGR